MQRKAAPEAQGAHTQPAAWPPQVDAAQRRDQHGDADHADDLAALPLAQLQRFVKAVQPAQPVAAGSGVEHGACWRIEIHAQERSGIRFGAGKDHHGFRRLVGEADSGGARTSFQRRLGTPRVLGIRQRDLRTRDCVALRIELRVDFVVIDQDASRQSDQDAHRPERESEPQVNLHPERTQAEGFSVRHARSPIMVPPTSAAGCGTTR